MNSATTTTDRKIDPMNVKNIEEVIYLLQESERIGGETDAKTAYMKGLEYINNL